MEVSFLDPAPVTRASKSAIAMITAQKAPSFFPISPPAPIACGKSSTLKTAAIAIRSSIAPTAAHASPIIESLLAYDRPATSMKKFTMCPRVRARIRRPARPPLPCAAQRLPAVRPATGAVGCGGRKWSWPARMKHCGRPPILIRAGNIVAPQGNRRLPAPRRCPQ